MPDFTRADTLNAEFFDSAYEEIDGRLNGEAASRADVESILEWISPATGGIVLDCPCGYGRHSVELQRLGMRVISSDLSQPLLEATRARLPTPNAVRADYRSLPMASDTFDMALALSTPLGYRGIDDDRQALRELARVVKRGAPIVIETAHRDMVQGSHTQAWTQLRDGSYLLVDRRFDYLTSRTTTTHIWCSGGRDVLSRTRQNTLYTVSEWLRLGEDVGLNGQVFGDLSGNPYSPERRIVLLFKRS